MTAEQTGYTGQKGRRDGRSGGLNSPPPDPGSPSVIDHKFGECLGNARQSHGRPRTPAWALFEASRLHILHLPSLPPQFYPPSIEFGCSHVVQLSPIWGRGGWWNNGCGLNDFFSLLNRIRCTKKRPAAATPLVAVGDLRGGP